jgi:hypothetical protein
MRRGRPEGSGARPLAVAAGLATVLALIPPVPAARAADPDPPGTRFSVGVLAGTTQFDTELADYQWNTRPRAAWGLRGLAGFGRWAAGVRFWTTRTTQSIGDLGEAPGVRASSLELQGEGRIAGGRGTRLLARAGGGWLHLGYRPDRITIQPSGPAAAIEVDLRPVNTWTGGGGLAVEHALWPGWSAALGVERRMFAIDTAHRAGDEVVLERRIMGDWTARVELTRVLMKGATP